MFGTRAPVKPRFHGDLKVLDGYCRARRESGDSVRGQSPVARLRSPARPTTGAGYDGRCKLCQKQHPEWRALVVDDRCAAAAVCLARLQGTTDPAVQPEIPEGGREVT